MALEFDPYRRPPAARLLAIIVTGGMYAWLISSGQHSMAVKIRRDPNAYLRHLTQTSEHSWMADLVVSILLVALAVFIVDALTSLFGRWLRERPHVSAGTAGPPPSRAEALLGHAEPPPPTS